MGRKLLVVVILFESILLLERSLTINMYTVRYGTKIARSRNSVRIVKAGAFVGKNDGTTNQRFAENNRTIPITR